MVVVVVGGGVMSEIHPNDPFLFDVILTVHLR